jgi:hypothetical protein
MAFVDAAQAVVDDSFAEFGKPATYNDNPVPVTIIVDLRDEGARPDDGRPVAGQITIEVRKSEIAQPSHGDTFTFGARTATVSNRPQLDEDEGLVWKMWAE